MIATFTNTVIAKALMYIAPSATTEELGTVPELGLEDTKHAIDAASKAFKTWSKTTAKVRPSFLVLSHCAHSDERGTATT